jgi:8-oxo-dGTP pyrophosphatase MutT (NUDIX family)
VSRYSVLLVFESCLLDRFLLAEHRSRGWELPGGRVEAGEDPQRGAAREWMEETGLPLGRLEEVARHRRLDGSTGHLFLGAVLDQGKPPEQGIRLEGAVDPEGRILGQTWVHRLQEVAPLAFPHDPYLELAGAVLERARDGPWRLPEGETPEGFSKRLSRHPEARPRGDPVEVLPP